MSIMDNEGHDPQGFMNAPNRTEVSSLKTENERLRAALTQISNMYPYTTTGFSGSGETIWNLAQMALDKSPK